MNPQTAELERSIGIAHLVRSVAGLQLTRMTRAACSAFVEPKPKARSRPRL